MNLHTLGGLLLATAGSTALYLSSPHQRWRARAWPARPSRTAGTALLLGSAWSFGQVMQGLTTAFVLLTTLMWTLMLLPYLGAWRSLRRGQA